MTIKNASTISTLNKNTSTTRKKYIYIKRMTEHCTKMRMKGEKKKSKYDGMKF